MSERESNRVESADKVKTTITITVTFGQNPQKVTEIMHRQVDGPEQGQKGYIRQSK